MDWQTLGTFVGVLAFIGFLAQWRATARRDRRDDLMVEIRAEVTRAALIEAHDAQPPERYFRFLDRLLAWSGRVYGPRWSLRSFGTCLSLAYLYPFLAALIAWVATGQTQIGALPVFAEVAGVWPRLARACLTLLLLAAIALIFRAYQRYSTPAALWGEKRMAMLTGRAGSLSKAARPVIEIGALAVAGALAGALAVAGAVAFAVAGDLQAASLVGFF